MTADVSGHEPAYRWALLACLATAGLFAAFLAVQLLWVQPLGVDFLPMWTAARMSLHAPDKLYDFAAITNAQVPILGFHPQLRPWIYPPSALLAVLPFAVLPFWPAYGAWVAATLGLYLWAGLGVLPSGRRLGLALLLCGPATAVVALGGQMAFLIGGMTVLGLAQLERRPALAGALLGVATAIKPSLLVLLPLALIAARQWRALAAAAIAGAAMGLAATAAFGLAPWFAWLKALSAFQAIALHNLPNIIIAPGGALAVAGFSGTALAAARVALAIIGVALAWSGFRRSDAWDVRLIALVGGSLFLTPYAVDYEAAVLAPAMVSLVLRRAGQPGGLGDLARWLVLSSFCIPFFGAMAASAFVLSFAPLCWGGPATRPSGR